MKKLKSEDSILDNYVTQFIQWTKLKIKLHFSDFDQGKLYFKEREVWWASLGVNIGFEQDGKNNHFERPVLVLKKFNKTVLWILPLTRSQKNNKYYFKLKQHDGDSFVILSQLRLISSKRLTRRMRKIEVSEFQKIKEILRNFLE